MTTAFCKNWAVGGLQYGPASLPCAAPKHLDQSGERGRSASLARANQNSSLQTPFSFRKSAKNYTSSREEILAPSPANRTVLTGVVRFKRLDNRDVAETPGSTPNNPRRTSVLHLFSSSLVIIPYDRCGQRPVTQGPLKHTAASGGRIRPTATGPKVLTLLHYAWRHGLHPFTPSSEGGSCRRGDPTETTQRRETVRTVKQGCTTNYSNTKMLMR